MAGLAGGELKVATSIPIERAPADDSEALKKNISYKYSLCTEHRPQSETYKFRVEDPERSFQALLNLRQTILVKTLNELDTTLVSGEDGVAGAAYEGNWYINDSSAFSRLTILETENTDEYKRLEVGVKHIVTNNCGGLDETWIFEIQQRPADGAWELSVVLKQGKVMNNFELAVYTLVVGYMCFGILVVSLAFLPCTVCLMHQGLNSKKEKMLPFYRHVLGSNDTTHPTKEQRMEP